MFGFLPDLFFAFFYTECCRYPFVTSTVRPFDRNADYKLSQTYDNVVAIAIQCISNGNSEIPETAFYADAYFTFKQADGMTGGTFRSVYSSQNFSTGIWKADGNKGIQLSSVSMKSHWNSIRCDVVNVTTSKLVYYYVLIYVLVIFENY